MDTARDSGDFVGLQLSIPIIIENKNACKFIKDRIPKL